MARFFCDHCGAEVPRNSKRCSRCGRYFAFVRCPQCGFTGEEFLFKDGCPVCGYCALPGRDGEAPDWPVKRRAGKLPLWVYLLAAAALLAVAVILVMTVR
ncbi:MAG: zinc-ribbon domain-containing protein [Treponema sp.]|nr:zinc-ribbon domain-containing protein [Treponema sp.]